MFDGLWICIKIEGVGAEKELWLGVTVIGGCFNGSADAATRQTEGFTCNASSKRCGVTRFCVGHGGYSADDSVCLVGGAANHELGV